MSFLFFKMIRKKNNYYIMYYILLFIISILLIYLLPLSILLFSPFSLSPLGPSKQNNIGRTRISRWLGRENKENVARTKNCCGWPSFPRVHMTYKMCSSDLIRNVCIWPTKDHPTYKSFRPWIFRPIMYFLVNDH